MFVRYHTYMEYSHSHGDLLRSSYIIMIIKTIHSLLLGLLGNLPKPKTVLLIWKQTERKYNNFNREKG